MRPPLDDAAEELARLLLRADNDHDSIVSSGSDNEGNKDWLQGLAQRAIEPDIKARIAKGAFVFVKPAFKPGRHFYVNEAIPACKQALQELQLRKQLQGHRFQVTGTIEFDHDGEPASFEVQALVPAASHQPSANSRDAALSSSAALSHAKSPQNQQGRSTTPCLPLEAVSIAQAAAQAAVQLMAGEALNPGPSAAASDAASRLDSSSLHFHDPAMCSSSYTASGKGAAATAVAARGSMSQGASEKSARYQRHHRHRDAEQQPSARQWASQPREVSRELSMHPQQQRAAAADGGSAEKVPGESMGRPHEVNRQAGGQHVPAQLHALPERPHALEADGRGQEGRAGVRRGHAVARPHGGSEHPGMDSGFNGQQAHSKQQRLGHHSRPAGVQGAGYQVSPQLGQDGSHTHRHHSRGPRHQVERERLIGVQGRADKETPATPARRQGSHKHAVNQSQGMGAGGHTQQLNIPGYRGSPHHRAHPAQFSDSSLDSDGGSEAASQTSSSDDSWLATSTSHSTRPGKQLATLPGRMGDGSDIEDAVSSAHSFALHAVRSLPTDPRERIRARKQQDVQAYSKEQRSIRQLAKMGDAGEDWLHAEELNLTPLEDDCKLLGSVLDDTLKSEVGARIYAKLAKIRGQAHAASLLERNGDSVGAGQVQERMRQELMAMPLEEALPIVRAFGHYLNLSSIAELQHRLRRNRTDARKSSKSCDEAFGRLIAEGISPDKLYEAVTTQVVEVVLTAHPTQVNRRTLQYKHTRIAALLQQNDRPDLVKEERDNLLEDIAREVTALWQTDELRRQKPSPVDEARGGLNIVEQSLWNAVPAFMRKQSAALKRHTGRDLPLNATPFRFASWMGGDRDGNPNVTAKVTSHVVCLARWMAADMYLREVDALRFELSMSSCSPEVWRMAKRIIRKHAQRVSEADARHAASAAYSYGTPGGAERGGKAGGSGAAAAAAVPGAPGGPPPPSATVPSLVRTNNRRVALKQSTQGAHLPEGMVIGVRPDTYRESAAGLDGMPAVPGVLPGQDLEGGSECDFDLEDDEEGEGSQMDPLDTLTSDGPSGSTTPLHGMSKPNSQINIPAAALLGAGIPSASASVAAITERIKEKEMLMSEASDEVGALRSNGLNGTNGFGATMGAAAPGGLFAPGGTSTSASGGMGGRGLFLSPAMSVSAAQLDRAASQGVTDPSPLRRSLRSQRAAADNIAFKRMHEHPGFHPYRVILGDVRQKLINTRKRMEELLSQVEPSDTDEYYADTEELEKPLRAIYWSLYECGGGMVADGRLLDLVRRVATFGLCLMKLDIRQESTRHSEALDAVTTYLGYGSYLEWDEDKRIEWLINELQGRRPLIPPGMPMSAEVREVLDTARVVAQLGPGSLGAYVISMTKAASDVLAVELLQREAIVQVSPEERWESNPGRRTLRVVPLFETLEDLDAGGPIMRRLLALPWYRQHVRHAHGNHQEVMLGYSDSGKDAGRLAANWALYRCQEELVAVMREAEVTLTLFHGRGGTVGRGGGPTYLAIQSQPPGSVEGSFRITEQGEMVQAKFGISAVAQYQLEIYTTAVLLASVKPPSPPKHQCWRDVMTRLGEVSCEAYRAVVYKDPAFITYFKHATPEAELGNLNIGSRPARRRADNAGINTLRAIPWQFAWTQTRLILPSWLGIGDALFKAIEEGHLPELQAMYREWPFFAATIDLIEMILAKSDARIAALYEDVLVSDPEELQLGQRLRVKLLETCRAVLLVSGHKMLLEHNPTLRKLIQMRNPYIDPINIMQVEVLRRLRQDPNNIKLRDALLVSINGIAAGMRNTG